MIIRVDNYPHGDLFMHNRLMADPTYDQREHIYSFLHTFEDKGIPYVLGVSPGLINRESDLFFLKSLNFCEIAMHGFSHGWDEYALSWHCIDQTLPQGGEFAFADYESIRKKIKNGIEILSLFNIRKFIAPFNVYTQALLDVLNEFNFEMIMGGAETIAFGMDRLDHGNLRLDLTCPPFCGKGLEIISHIERALDEDQTIALQWIYEIEEDVDKWYRIAETIANRRTNKSVDSSIRNKNHPEKGSDFSPCEIPGRHLSRILPIAIVTETLNYVSGGVRCIVEVLNRLKAKGYDCSCFVTHPDLRCEWLDVNFAILPVSDFDRFKGIAVSPYSPTAEIVAHSNAVGKFYWVHSYEPKFPELTGRADSWRIMSENSYRLPELQYFAVSTYVKMILELIYKRDVLSTLVPGGVDTELFKPGEKKGNPLRIMFLSRENAFRGGKDIAKALKIADKKGMEMEIFVMGRKMDLPGLTHSYIPPLPQNEFAQLLGSVDIFIHASHFEGLPLPPLEAMACGCAVISTYVGASDYLLNGYNASVVPPGRPDRIAESLLLLAGDSRMRQRIAGGGLETVGNGYKWSHTIDRFEEALVEGMSRQYNTPGITLQDNKKISIKDKSNVPADKGYSKSKEEKLCPQYLVSAILSVYNSERFIRGCIDDLEAQTIADQIEIIVVNSGSGQQEEVIVKELQEKYKNIKYIKTEQRETVYAAWNRGISIASGKYITNANTDDRHRTDAIETMSTMLESHPEIALVYADVIITETENEIFENCTPVGYYRWLNWEREALLKGCFIGPQPMWRKSLHEEYGYFDDSFVTSGDYEFWLRISQTNSFLHISELLGLYLRSDSSIEHLNRSEQQDENSRILQDYKRAQNAGTIIRRCKKRASKDLQGEGVLKENKDDRDRLQKIIDESDILYQQGRIDAAVNILLAAIKQSPSAKMLYYSFAGILIDTMQYDDALDVLSMMPPDNNDLKKIELSGYCKEGKQAYADALLDADRALAIGARSAPALNLKGMLAYRDGDKKVAEEYFQHALESDSEYGIAYTNLGAVKLEKGLTQEALDLFKKGFTSTPQVKDVADNYYEVISELGAYESAEYLFKEAIQAYPENKKLAYLFIDILLKQNKYKAAMDAIENCIVRFDFDEGLIATSSKIRSILMPHENENQSRATG